MGSKNMTRPVATKMAADAKTGESGDFEASEYTAMTGASNPAILADPAARACPVPITPLD